MKTWAIAVIVIVFGSGATLLAQEMVEYSHVAAKPPVGLQGLSNKLNGGLEKSAVQSSPGAKVQTIGPSSGGAASNSAAKPAPPALFILGDGKQLESSHYVLTAQSLVIQDGPNPQTIPLNSLNREATVAANRKRGLDLKFPNGASQMTISF